MSHSELKPLLYPDQTPVCQHGLIIAISISDHLRRGNITAVELLNYADCLRRQFKNPNIAAEYSRVPLGRSYVANKLGNLFQSGQLEEFVSSDNKVQTGDGPKTILELGYEKSYVEKIHIETLAIIKTHH